MKSVSFYFDAIRQVKVSENSIDRANFAINLLGHCPVINPKTFLDVPCEYRRNCVYDVAFYSQECIGAELVSIEKNCATKGSLYMRGYAVRTGKRYSDYYCHYHHHIALLPNIAGYILDGSITIDKIPFEFSIHIFDNRIVHIELETKVISYCHLYMTGSDLEDVYITSLSSLLRQITVADIREIKQTIRRNILGYEQTIAKLQGLL